MANLKPELKSFLKRPSLETFVIKATLSPFQQKDLGISLEEIEAIILPLIPDPVPVEVKDLLPLIQSLIPDIKDGVTPSEQELLDLITPLIPENKELTPKDIVEKINKGRGDKIKRSRVEGLDEVEGIARTAQKQVQAFTSLGGSRQTAIKASGTLLGTGITTINFVGATGTKIGDGSEVNITTGGGTGTVQSVVAGTGISVNNTDPANPIVSATGTAITIYSDTVSGTINSSNTVFTVTNTITTAIALWLANSIYQPGVDFTVTGAKQITMTIAPDSSLSGQPFWLSHT